MTGLAPAGEGMEIERALPHGHVLAALGTARAVELDALLPRGKERRHQLALALIVARVLAPSAKLATARALDPATASHSLGATLELGPVKVKELYATLDWLGKHQEGIERRLARRHLGSGTLVLYDVTSSYLEGRHCPLARRGYSRDGKKGKLQIVFGLICNAAGCPVAVSKAIRHSFGQAALIQRCQVHKGRNITEHLDESLHAGVRKALRQAWNQDDADKAERLLRNLARRLEHDAPGVSKSIQECLDEILTVIRLGLPPELRRSLACTNAIENALGTVRLVQRNIKRWRNAEMALRWTAAELLEAKKTFRRLKAYRQLPILDVALRRVVEKAKDQGPLDEIHEAA